MIYRAAYIALVWAGTVGMMVASTISAQDADVRQAEDGVRRLRVLTYNIHHAEGTDRRLDVPRIAAVINRIKPDLVSLQEVDRGTMRTERVDQAEELARLTGMHVAFGGNIRYQGGDYGNAVLSRWPIVRHQNHLLPSLDDGEQRGVLYCEIVVPGPIGTLAFLATHLDSRRDDRERLAAGPAIEKLIAAGQPAILAGDINDEPETRVLAQLKNSWTVANADGAPTVPAGMPNRQIDYVFYRPAARWQTLETQVLDVPVASDHRPVLAVLEWQPVRETMTK